MRSVGKGLGVDESTVRGWKKNQEKLKSFASAKKGIMPLRQVRRIGGSNSAAFPELEQKLISWVTDRNKKGLRVKDKYIQARALALKEEILAEYANDGDQNQEKIDSLEKFLASTNWCARFKNRFELTSRRHTTSRTFPENFQDLAQEFIAEIQDLITTHNIRPNRIVNFDQVPRYFECENTSTIVKRGTREVLLKKASTSHKRFTFTPVISADGNFLALHLLFSNLKNKPKVNESCIVDVNKTGMFNMEALTRIIDECIVKKCQTPFREPTLILFDAYGTHVKFVQEKSDVYEQRNVFLRIIPARMTGLLQPLDVAVNRSFQQAYNDHYTEHLSAAVNNTDPTTRTKAGNVKMPGYQVISEWVSEWASDQTRDSIANAFKVCGLVSRDEFEVDRLHKPLRDCFLNTFSLDDWLTQNPDFLTEDLNTGDEAGEYIIYSEPFNFFKALHAELGINQEYGDWLKVNKVTVKNFIQTDAMLSSLFTDHETSQFDDGNPTDTKVEIVAATKVFKVAITIIEIDKECNILNGSGEKYDPGDADKNIEILSFENNFGIRIQAEN